MNQKEAVLCYPHPFSFPSCPVGMFRQRKQSPCPLDLCTSGRHIQEYKETSCACKGFYNRQPDGEKRTQLVLRMLSSVIPSANKESHGCVKSSSPWQKRNSGRCMRSLPNGGCAWTRQGRELARWLGGDTWLCPGFLPSCPVGKHRGSVSSSAAMHVACGCSARRASAH